MCSVVSREKVASPQCSHTSAGIFSTSTRRPSTLKTSLTSSDFAALWPQTWQLNMATSVSGFQSIHLGQLRSALRNYDGQNGGQEMLPSSSDFAATRKIE